MATRRGRQSLGERSTRVRILLEEFRRVYFELDQGPIDEERDSLGRTLIPLQESLETTLLQPPLATLLCPLRIIIEEARTPELDDFCAGYDVGSESAVEEGSGGFGEVG